MTRRIIYGISFWVFLAASALTLTSLLLPSWITYRSPTSPSQSPIRVSYGLHQRCSSITGACQPFPQYEDCHGEDRGFCSMWRSAGFLMNLAAVFELASLACYVVVLAGGRGMREGGWKMLGGLMGVVVVAQVVAMALVAYLYDHDNRFFVGWELDKSWIMCTVSWTVLLFDIVGLVGAALFMPSEDDYEPIPDAPRSVRSTSYRG